MKISLRKIKFIVIFIISVFMSMSFSVSTVQAANLADKYFESEYEYEGIKMELRGTGLKSVFFMKAFIAGLYTEDKQDAEEILGEPKHIEVKYFVNVPAKKLSNFTIKNMKKNITEKEFMKITDEVELMRQYFVDLKPGDRFGLTYIPKKGTKFIYNGEQTGFISGEDFARALFSVWLGKKPFDKKLKSQILGSET